MPYVLWSALDPRTENSSVMPGQRLRPPTPKNDSTAYDSSVPTGVDALNIARCRLQSAIGRSVATRDVVSASAVGAVNDSQPPPYVPCAESDVAQHTFVDSERQEAEARVAALEDKLMAEAEALNEAALAEMEAEAA